ncbi:dynactin subunit 1 [Calliphora vicina]|uniref:dynactin subunit 1 n=1 Tax=Calliphora vicina TaxID=7373 RepID=UPI00325A49EB
MSEKNIKVGARIELTGKDLQGTIAYVGMTSFAVGKWVGVVLDEPKGKNNGSIKGQSYFECSDNYGMFVRPTQLKVIQPAPDGRKSTEDIAAGGGDGLKHTAPQPTKTRLSGPRNSLSSSRISLSGSRSQLTSSLNDRSGSTNSMVSRKSMQASNNTSALSKDNNSASNTSLVANAQIDIPANANMSKKNSFVETGFMEILKPQFTPSQPLRSPSFSSPPNQLSSQEMAEQKKQNEELQAQINDLNEKLQTLKQRRNEDKERLRDFDKMKIQFEQLQEFRTQIMASQASLQKELQRAKQEAKDAIEAKERHAQEMAELSDNVELITLDKEMAEEKAESLQLELDAAKERIDELQVDYELLSSEIQDKAETSVGHIGDGGPSVYEFKQMEQQNIRLKETLVRLRDLSAHDKHDIQKLTKELETKKSEVAELERTKEKLSSKVEELEAIVADLQEQVDAALGAEAMVETLTEKKFELEDRVKLLEEEVAQLEALEEVHEQLIESNHDLEMDLREELDLAQAAKKEVLRERDAAIETIYDRDQTITKFRELVQKLNEQMIDLRDKATASNDPKSLQDTHLITNETVDYKQMFAESKAYTKAIDVQLRQIELTQANEHTHMLSAFMPESFMSRGGDHDSILVILLISRLVFKCGIVISQTRERFPAVENVTKESIIQGHSVQQYAFKCRLMHYIHNLQCALHQILYGLNSCQPDTLLRAGSSLPEMIAQEKTIDGIIELLKSNQLDENSTTDNIEKCVAFFNAMNSVLLAGEDLLNETQMIRDCVAAIQSACESVLNDTAIARAILRQEGSTSDAALLMQFLADNVESIKQQVKLIRRRLPQDLHVIKCGISPLKLEAMRSLTQQLSRIMSALYQANKQAVAIIVASIEGDNDNDHCIDPAKFWESLSQACERIYEQDDRGPSQNFKGVLGAANNDLQQVAQYLLDKEYEIMSLANQKQEKPTSPIILRAQLIKKQLEQKNVLAATLENREADIKQLKLAAKMKQHELSEMQIRKDRAEKKLSVLQAEYDNALKWKKQYDDTLELLQKKEKEYEETFDHLQSDIEALESEKLTLKEKIKHTGIKRTGDSSFINTTAPAGHSTNTSFSTHTTGATPLIAEELQLLKHVFNTERAERLRLQAEQIKNKLKKFDPIFVPQPKDKRITELETELTKMKHAWALSLLQTQPKAGKDNQHIVAFQRKHLPVPEKSEISNKANHLAAEILKEYLQRNPHRAAISEFGAFPTVEVKRVLQL